MRVNLCVVCRDEPAHRLVEEVSEIEASIRQLEEKVESLSSNLILLVYLKMQYLSTFYRVSNNQSIQYL